MWASAQECAPHSVPPASSASCHHLKRALGPSHLCPRSIRLSTYLFSKPGHPDPQAWVSRPSPLLRVYSVLTLPPLSHHPADAGSVLNSRLGLGASSDRGRVRPEGVKPPTQQAGRAAVLYRCGPSSARSSYRSVRNPTWTGVQSSANMLGGGARHLFVTPSSHVWSESCSVSICPQRLRGALGAPRGQRQASPPGYPGI